MDHLKPVFATLWLVNAIILTEAQTSRKINCLDDQFKANGVINNIRVTCCIPNTLRGRARCTINSGYTTNATKPTTTTQRQVTINTQFITRTRTIINITAIPPRTTPFTTTTNLTTTTATPITTTDEEENEGSGDETNTGTVEEGQDLENPATTGLSIGIPLVVLAAVVVAVLLIRLRYKRKKEATVGDVTNLTGNGRVFVKPTMGGTSSQNDGEYQDFEKNVRTSPPVETYDSLHLYGNTVEPPHAYEQVPEKRDPPSYEALHVYSNSQVQQRDYDIPTPRVLYANLQVHSQNKR
ncbi:uncharacterized protein LOC117336459 [Pecten maximus]|uniref:uncharacterized protein LOC117336459 n=1 Tax=Pecten maximus TaxID=6579 RepID=UPI0014582EAD|nr:uncharacterized protein LOC117336459 [Pecten maximus]